MGTPEMNLGVLAFSGENENTRCFWQTAKIYAARAANVKLFRQSGIIMRDSLRTCCNAAGANPNQGKFAIARGAIPSEAAFQNKPEACPGENKGGLRKKQAALWLRLE
ncbi:MAG TPA: hypothetical protein VJV22_16950 [Acidobacteriaceae bacterium]|nr:hypothetical protein [Acidobacteriaceae bacterium]